MTPRERRQEQTRSRILAMALELISERGPDQVSLREIARRVNYSPAGIYEYFQSKEDILAALCQEGGARLKGMLEGVPGDLRPDATLVELGLAYLRFSREHREHFQLMFSRQLRQGPVHDRDPDESYCTVMAAVRRAMDAGLVAEAPDFGLREVTFGLWAVAHGLAALPIELPEAERGVFERFVRGLRPDETPLPRRTSNPSDVAGRDAHGPGTGGTPKRDGIGL